LRKYCELCMSKFWNSVQNVFLRIPLAERILFAKHLSMMLKSGMTTVESLKLVRRQIKSRRFGTLLDSAITDVENGQFLAEAFAPLEHVFGELFINIVKLGETSGTLSENLEYLAGEMKKSRGLRAKVRSAVIYPIVILVATLGLTGILVFFVLPKILPVFASLRIDLPLSTRILVGTAVFLNNYYLWLIGGFIAAALVLPLLLRLPKIRYAYHRLILLTPLVGRVSTNYNIANLTRTLGLLLKSGVKIVEAVTTAADIMPNLIYRRALREAAEEVKKGGSLYRYFEQHPHVFPTTVSRMIEVGEKTGNLDANLLYLADFYESEVDDTVKNLASTLEPVLLVTMGALVGFVVISIITPIYEVTQSLGGPR